MIGNMLAGRGARRRAYSFRNRLLSGIKRLTAAFAAALVLAAAGAVSADGADGRQMSNFTKSRDYVNNFSDISGHWADDYISNAYEYGVIDGMGGGLFAPEESLTVAQAITIAARLHSMYKYADKGQTVLAEYTEQGHWASPFLAYAENEGLILDDWSGALDRKITRAETVRIWSKILRPEDMEAANTVNGLPDVMSSTVYFDEIMLFYKAGIVQGSTINGVENCFAPYDMLTRAQAATIFMALVETGSRVSGRTYTGVEVKTLAGTGAGIIPGEEVTVDTFALPFGVAVDGSGKVVIFDTYNNSLKTVTGGKVTVMTGRVQGYGMDGFARGYYRDGELSAALFNRPTTGVFNVAGDLFVCDSENHVIRLIKNNMVYTYAGDTRGYADGTVITAMFDTPTAIAADINGNLYVADTMNNCVRKIDTVGNVTTIAGVAGDGGYADGEAHTALFMCPSGIAVSRDGSAVYVADTGNHVIRKIENGIVSTLAGVAEEYDEDGEPLGGFRDGAAHEVMFNLPKGIALAGEVLFVADSGNNAIRAVTMSGITYTLAGTGEPGNMAGSRSVAEFNQPSGVVWHDGVLYITDTTNNLIKTLPVGVFSFKEP